MHSSLDGNGHHCPWPAQMSLTIALHWIRLEAVSWISSCQLENHFVVVIRGGFRCCWSSSLTVFLQVVLTPPWGRFHSGPFTNSSAARGKRSSGIRTTCPHQVSSILDSVGDRRPKPDCCSDRLCCTSLAVLNEFPCASVLKTVQLGDVAFTDWP